MFGHTVRKNLKALVILAVLAAVAGSRAQQGDLNEVVLYVTRHALSCANIVSHWRSSKSKMTFTPNRRVRDPMLCKAGVAGSKAGSKDLAQRFEGKDSPGDAPQFVLSSVLLRAVETAMLQYPGHEAIHVVPHMREFSHSSGKLTNKVIGKDTDNLPNALENQSQTLLKVYGEIPTIVNWVEEHEREQPGDWAKFIEFLGTSFLPTYATSVSNSRMALAVVTHSNFMAKHLKHCKKHWIENGKPLNNQVVRIRYAAQLSTSNAYTLTPTVECENVVPGISYTDGSGSYKGLCLSDVGGSCVNKLAESDVEVPDTVDDQIRGLDAKLQHAGETMRDALEKAAEKGLQSSKGEHIPGKDEVEELTKKIEKLKSTTCLSGEQFQSGLA